MKSYLTFALAALVTLGLTNSLSADLVAHWPLDSDGTDVVGGHNSDPVDASITFDAAGQFGNAATFAGTKGLQVPYDAAINPTSFSLTAWVNPTSNAAWNSVVTSREDNGSTVNGFILYNSPDGNWDFWTGAEAPTGQWGRTTDPNPSALDTWTHLAITYDETNTTKTLWVNGDVAAQSTDQGYNPNGTTPENERPLNIGAGEDFGTNFYFTGRIDDVGLYNSALGEQEIESIMMNGVPEPTSLLLVALGSVSLLCLWRRRK